MKIFCYDLQTSGLDPKNCAIIELAGQLYEYEKSFKKIGKIHLQIQPDQQKSINLAALEVNGYKMQDLKNFEQDNIQFNKFINFLDQYINKYDSNDKIFLCGYNNCKFDDLFLRQWFLDNKNKYFGSYFHANSWDVMVLASIILSKVRNELSNFKLKTVAEMLKIKLNQKKLHKSYYDVEITIKILKLLMKNIKILQKLPSFEIKK